MTAINCKTLAASLGIFGLAVLTAHAAPLVNEAFDQYANGTTLTSTGNWTAFSGGGTLPLTASNGTVTATNVASGASGEDDRIIFSPTQVTTGLLYFSTLVTVPASNTGITAANGDYFFAAYSTGGYLARVFLAADTATAGVAFGLTTGTAPTNLGPDITLGTAYKLVLRVDLGTKTATLGVFAANVTPTQDSQLTVTSGTASTVTGLDSVAIRQGSAAGAAFTTVIDGIRVGTTLADVAGIATGPSAFFNAAAVPEPSTYALFAGGLLLLGATHRLRRQA